MKDHPIQQRQVESPESEHEQASEGKSLTPPPFQLMAGDNPVPPPAQLKTSSGGMPADLVQGFANSTGHDLSNVNVHRNSDKPASVGALAYAQGNDIHLGPGQEQHLAHEAGHIVQQREGRVQANTSVGGMPVNNSKSLESEADSMGAKAVQMKAAEGSSISRKGAETHSATSSPSQFETGSETSSAPVGSQENTLETTDGGTQEGSPLQAKFGNNAPLQRHAAPIQRVEEPKVPVKIYFQGTLNQEQFKQAAMKQLFGGPREGLKWELTGDSFTSPTTLNVAVSLLKQQRGQNNAQNGIPTGSDGSVAGNDKLRKDFGSMPAGADKDAIMKEIDRRYYQASGDAPGTKLGNGPQDAGKRELWKQIQDEVLFQNQYIKNLPEAVKKFIKYSTNGKILTPADFEQLFRIAKAIENMPPDIANDYLSRVSGETTDLDKFERSLHSFREEMDRQKGLVEQNNVVKGHLVNLEAIYKKYQLYTSMVSSAAMSSSMSMGGGQMGGMGVGTGLGTMMTANKLREEIDADCKAIGFANGIADFEKYIREFEVGFEKQAQLTATAYVEKYRGRLYKEQSTYKDNATMNDLLTKIKAGATKESLQTTYAIFNDKDLPDEKKVNMDRLKTAATGAALGTMLLAYSNTRIGDVNEAKAAITKDSRVIYKLTNLMPMFYLEQGFAPGSIFDMIIQDKIRRDALLKLVVGIVTAIVAIALAVVSMGAAVPGIVAAGAAAMGFGISAYSVYEEYKNYSLEKNLADAGLANDPSMVWLIIAVAGAVLDMAAVARALSKLGPAAKALQAGGDMAEFQKVVKAMREAGELDAKAAAAVEKAALAQRSFQQSKSAFEGLLAGGAKSFASPEIYAELVKMAKFKSMQGAYTLLAFVDEIKAMRKLKGLGDLGPDEIAKIRQAWEEGRAAARVAGEALEASDELVKSVKSSLQTRISSMPKFELKYTDAELKSLITKGRTNGFTPREIEDLILVGARKDKPLNAIQLMDQMDFAVYLKGRGFPAKFKSLEDFREFSSTLKSEISAIGGPTNDVRIQGSSLRTAAANDVDLVAMMPEKAFDDIIRKAYAGKLKENKVAVDLMSLDHKGLVDLAARIEANPKSFNAIRGDFMYVFQNKMINSKMMKSEIKAVFDAEGMLAKIQAKYPHLNIENVSFQIPGGAFDLQPFLRL